LIINHRIAENSRILARLVHDVSERDYLNHASALPLSRSQFVTLKILLYTGPFTIGDIASTIGISRAAASKNIDKLVKMKLVQRKEVPTDRRSTRVSILAAGEIIVESYDARRNEKQQKILSSFTDREKTLFNNLLEKYIRGALQHEGNFDLMCLMCGGEYDEACVIKDTRGLCYYKDIANVDETNGKSI